MFTNKRVINRILKLRFADNMSYRAISENMRKLKITHQKYSHTFNEVYDGVSVDYRTIKRICQYYEPLKDEFLKAVSKKNVKNFFKKYPPMEQARPGSTLNEKQILLCQKSLQEFLDSRSEAVYIQTSYKSYYNYLMNVHRKEFTYLKSDGNVAIFSYASMLPYLKNIYNPYDFIK